jgi:hypothetical protein
MFLSTIWYKGTWKISSAAELCESQVVVLQGPQGGGMARQPRCQSSGRHLARLEKQGSVGIERRRSQVPDRFGKVRLRTVQLLVKKYADSVSSGF